MVLVSWHPVVRGSCRGGRFSFTCFVSLSAVPPGGTLETPAPLPLLSLVGCLAGFASGHSAP